MLGSLVARPAAAQDTVASQLRTMIAQAHHPWSLRPDFPRYVDVAARLYASRADSPVWVSGSLLSSPGRAAIAELAAAADQGLVPGDYDAVTLQGLARGLPTMSSNAVSLARFDLLLTIDVIRYLDDLSGGRIRPGPFGQHRASPGPDLALVIANAVAGDSVPRLVAALQPQLAQYRNLRLHLARYRRLAADSPFIRLPPTAPVHPGERYAALRDLRRRLIEIGDLAADTQATPSPEYSGSIVDGVKRFQGRHALEPDGVLGRATFEALNVSFAARVSQIELALERLRALPPLGHQRFIVVNIPAFQLFAFESIGGRGAPTLEMKVVTGKALDTRTPVLFEELRYVELRPYWNVPRSILVKELLPLLRRHSGYLRANHMEVVGPRGKLVGDGQSAAVLKMLASGEARIRQKPGAWNALGLAKFVFPNASNVYLHGTPDAELFARSRRDFSHGCIRLEDPVGLAAWVLQDQPAWGLPAIEAAMNGAETTRVLLTKPMPVVVFYTTAVARPDGTIRFYDDVYGHDRDLAETLRAVKEPP
jgi:murein L,D-transpeptidase YcbB/YkuD